MYVTIAIISTSDKLVGHLKVMEHLLPSKRNSTRPHLLSPRPQHLPGSKHHAPFHLQRSFAESHHWTCICYASLTLPVLPTPRWSSVLWTSPILTRFDIEVTQYSYELIIIPTCFYQS